MFRALYPAEMGFSVFSYINLFILLLILMLCLVFLGDMVLDFVLYVQVILGGFPHFNCYHHGHQSCRAGNHGECWLIRIRWHLKVAGRDKAQTKQSAQQFIPLTNAALAGWTSNELQIIIKVTSSLSLASSAEDKERLQGVAKNMGRGRNSVPLKQIKGKERLVVSGVTLKGFDERQLPKDGINYLLQAWANWLLCKHQCTGSLSDVILIHIRTVIYSFSPFPFFSPTVLSSHQHKSLFTLLFFDSSVTFFSSLTFPFHYLWILSLLSTIFILSSSFGHAVPGILPPSQERSQLSKVFFQLFGSLRLHHLREICHLSKRERAAGEIQGLCYIGHEI